MYLKILILSILFASAASAQQAQQPQPADQARTAAAVPSLIQQRNNAMDGLAVCNGDLQTLQQKLTQSESDLKAANEHLEKLKSGMPAE